MKQFTNNIIVTLNHYDTDTLEEIEIVKQFVQERNCEFALNDSYLKGGNGSMELANKVVDVCQKQSNFKLLYKDEISILDKIETVCTKIYHASNINYDKIALEKIKTFEKLGYSKYPICIAKTQYSISDDPKKLGYPKDYELYVQDANIYTGAEFIVIYLGKIMTMPGLSKHPNYENIDIDSNYQIKGLF